MRWLKRVMDIVLVLAAAPLWVPLAVLVAVLIALQDGRPVLFRQARAGRDARTFHILKFRTMSDARDEDGDLLPDLQRRTPLGTFLRKSSLDELPQLLNVLKGDVSLVGPRPLHVRYVPRYSQAQRRRLDVPPGITGWAQVNGRNALDWEAKLALDTWYVEHWSFWLDLKILAMTVGVIALRRGVDHSETATMEEFMGNETSMSPEDAATRASDGPER